MTVQFVSVPIEDHTTALGQVASVLGDADVNIKAFAVDRSGVRFLTEEPSRAVENLEANGYEPTTLEVLEVAIPDRPGSLARLAQTLGEAGVQIVSAFGVAGPGGPRIFLRADDAGRAEQVLMEKGWLAELAAEE